MVQDGNAAKQAVRNLTMAVSHGECFGLLGPNGAGKVIYFYFSSDCSVSYGTRLFLLASSDCIVLYHKSILLHV